MEGKTSSNHSSKEVMLLRDQLEAEALTIKKFMDYKTNMNDPEICSMVDNMIEKHKGHYSRILDHLK
jgi:hypothetical protein